MKVKIDYECECPLPEGQDWESLAAKTIAEVLEQESCPVDVRVSLLVTDEASIQETNRQFRQIDRPTDVLSFPAMDFDLPASWELLDEEGDFDPETGELLLGDIMICAPKVEAQASEFGHSVRREFAFLVAHSTLHLIGYDHMEPEEAADMETRQEKALEALGITRRQKDE